jgi:hypothetical protein
MTLEMSGFLRELQHKPGDVVEYEFVTDGQTEPMSEWLGRAITLRATGRKCCIHCGRPVKKLYQSGYCFPCVTTLAECDLCIVKPHECHFHRGTCRDEQFAQRHCMISHYVYLAVSSGVKVGLTRKGRQFVRWVDQGASQAILLAELPTRKAAGELEVEVAKALPDKTDWRKMLRYDDGADDVDLAAVKQEVIRRLPPEFQSFVLADENTVYRFTYPITPGVEVNLAALSLDKTAELSGVLLGIKGQYLMLDSGVFNVKKHAGYEIHLSVS